MHEFKVGDKVILEGKIAVVRGNPPTYYLVDIGAGTIAYAESRHLKPVPLSTEDVAKIFKPELQKEEPRATILDEAVRDLSLRQLAVKLKPILDEMRHADETEEFARRRGPYIPKTTSRKDEIEALYRKQIEALDKSAAEENKHNPMRWHKLASNYIEVKPQESQPAHTKQRIATVRFDGSGGSISIEQLVEELRPMIFKVIPDADILAKNEPTIINNPSVDVSYDTHTGQPIAYSDKSKPYPNTMKGDHA